MPEATALQAPLSVTELTGQIKELLEEGFSSLAVLGEITEWKPHSSGHCYFKLRDKGAVLSAVLFAGDRARLRREPREGEQVIARGRVTVYAPRGNYQFVVSTLQTQGQGAQDLALRQLKQKLEAKGYFARERKRPLPRFPRCIALITSPTGAAVRDMLEVLGRRWPALEVLLRPVRVQGELAAGEIAEALALVNRVGGAEAIIVGRGGGSGEDLAAFNDERVADAIFASRLPVVSAVGHEIDVTIADLVADFRALTPSEAAERIVPDRREVLALLEELSKRMREQLRGRVRLAQERLMSLADRRVFSRPLDRVRELSQRVDEAAERLSRNARQRLERLQQALQAQAGQLESLSPLNVLARGYSLTRRAQGGPVVRSAGEIQVGERVETVLRDGKFISRVEEIGPPAEF